LTRGNALTKRITPELLGSHENGAVEEPRIKYFGEDPLKTKLREPDRSASLGDMDGAPARCGEAWTKRVPGRADGINR